MLQKKGTVVLFNDFGYLFELNLDDQDRAYIGKRRIDIEAHNKLTPAERNRQRDDPHLEEHTLLANFRALFRAF